MKGPIWIDRKHMQAFFKGISFRLAKVGVVLAFVLGLVMSSIQLYLDYQGQEEALQALINRVIEVAAPPAARAVHTLDDDLSVEVVNGLLTYDFIYNVSITDELGNVLARGTKPRKETATSWLTRHIAGDSRRYSASLSIPGYGDTTTGKIEFDVDLNTALAGFFDRSVFVILSGFFRNMLLVLMLFGAFYYLLTRPLIRLVSEIKAINPEHPAEKRLTSLPDHRTDELAQLVTSSNQMLNAVEDALGRRLEVEEELRSSEQMVSNVVNNLPAIVGLLNKQGDIKFCNQYMADFYGQDISTMLQSNMGDFDFVYHDDPEIIPRLVGRTQDYYDQAVPFEGYFYAVDGKRHYMQGNVKGISMRGEDYNLIVANDMTDRKSAEDKMEYMAYHDALTNLPNRLYLVERLEHELCRARRHNYFGAVLFIDLDHFKNINDSLGHPVGDQVLKKVANRLTDVVREEDLVARLSGDEFVVALTVLDSEIETAALKAGEVAEKIRKYISEPYYHEDMKLHVSCSVGIVVYSDKESSVHELLRFADTAMYQVKEKGRDAIEFFNVDMADKVSRQLVMEGELHRALEDKQFELFYQSKICAKTDKIIGAEALLRWRHPERGLVSPVEFIPILETSGLILDVGQWVIEEACRQLQVWHEMGVWEEGMKLSINISPRQFRRQAFVDDVAKILHHIPIPEKSLDMEITEGVVIHNVEEAISTLTTLTSMGISFSLDDFGTGYSSISYLKRLPVSTLKIDRSFIRDISYDRSDRVLVETIITMGRLLDLNVIAEGVEDKEQVEILKGFNCDSYQGFLFCKPLMVEEFQQLLIAEEKSLRQSV